MKRLIDLSHTIEDGMITYKGLPAPVICDYLSREKSREVYAVGYEFQIAKIEMVSNTGTYLDVPFHRFAHGKDMSEVSLEKLADLEAVLVHADFSNGIEVGIKSFEGVEVRNKAVLIHTNWSKHWRTDVYYENHPFLSEEAARYLRDAGARLVGIDSHNLDDTRTKARPAHTILLEAEVLIVEHMCNLHLVPDGVFRFNAVPPRFKGVGTFPVRAYAVIE